MQSFYFVYSPRLMFQSVYFVFYSTLIAHSVYSAFSPRQMIQPVFSVSKLMVSSVCCFPSPSTDSSRLSPSYIPRYEYLNPSALPVKAANLLLCGLVQVASLSVTYEHLLITSDVILLILYLHLPASSFT